MTCAHRPLLLRLVLCSFAAGWLGIFSGCAWTGMFESRNAVIFPEDEELALGQKAFDQAIVTRTPSKNSQHRQMVEQVGGRLAKASDHAGWSWQFLLVQGEKAEAACLPGGKMIVSEGMVARCGNEAGLAAVMAHEIGHVVAHHGNQRMAELSARSGRNWLKPWKRGEASGTKQEMMQASYGLGAAGNGANPFSQIHEAEADSIGLKIMAKAGYDPREAPKVWERLARGDRQDRPEFANLHPADDDRTKKLTKLMPTALAYYAQSPQLGTGLAIAKPPEPPKGVTLASHTQASDQGESRPQVSHAAVAEKPASHEDEKPADKKLVRTADAAAVASNDPFLGSPKPVTTTTPPVAATQVPLHPVDEPSTKSTRFAAYAPEGFAPSAETASPPPHTEPASAAVPARPSEPQPVPTSRWARPVPVSADGPPRVARPTIDLSETPLPEQDDNWRTTQEPRANPFAGR